MKFSDEGIIIFAKKHGENSLIIKILSKENGVCTAFVRQSTSPKNYSKYQIGNLVFFDLYAKNSDSLSYVRVENLASFASRHILSFTRLNIITLFCLIISKNFMDQDPNKDLFSSFILFLQSLGQDDKVILANIIKFELKLLEISGYGLDLSSCAVTGKKDDLYFISPKSGRVASYESGKPYEDKLFLLTKFFKNNLILSKDISGDDLMESVNITIFFMKKYDLLSGGLIDLSKKINKSLLEGL